MTESSSVKNKRIARNTLILYVRTLITLFVSLYTSRIVLSALGVDNYGVYNVVGGVVGLFTIISGPISGAISRFLTYGLGKGNLDHLRGVFSTAIITMLLLGGVVVVLCESVGLWFLNYHLNIPAGSVYAANWVLQFSILSMVLGLINMPYSAAIISHERMDIYAYMTLLDVGLKLALAFLLMITPFNVLITYGFGLFLIYVIDRLIYGVYCTKKFSECKFIWSFDRLIFRKMTGFAWWSFLGNTAWVLNNQGASMLMNVYFGVLVNTAKGIASQVETAVMHFVNTFTTAFTPQIIKSYAEGNKDYMFSLMERGTKFSVYLMLLFLIPLEFEADQVLLLWLGQIPEYSSTFLRFSLVCTTLVLLGQPYLAGINAHGNIRNYQLTVAAIVATAFFMTWLAYYFGAPVITFYWIFMAFYFIADIVRMWFVQILLGYRITVFLRKVLFPIMATVLLSLLGPAMVCYFMEDGIGRLFLVTGVSTLSISVIVYLIGVNSSERQYVNKVVTNLFHKVFSRKVA